MDKLDHLGWVVSSSYAIGDARFAVRSTSHAFGEWLSVALGAYEVDDVEEFLYSVVVPERPTDGKAKEFFILYKGSTAIIRTLDPVTLGRGLLAELEGLLLHKRTDAVYIMGAVIDVSGTPALVPSTLVPSLVKLGRRAARLGIEIPGERTVAMDLETASVVPVRPILDVAEHALERLGVMCPWAGADGLRFVGAPETVRALLVPARNPDASLQPARKGYALAILAGFTLNLHEVGGRGLHALGRFVERTSCYESAWADADDVLARFANLLRDTVNGHFQDGERSAAGIDGAFSPLQRSDVTAIVLEGETVVLAEGGASAFFLDELATLVWNTFDGSASLDELAEDFADAFMADPSVVREDILTLTRLIGRAGLLQGIAYEEPSEPSYAWPTGVGVGEPIPPFKLPDAGGHEVAVSDLVGREVLLVNWSPRCGFCTAIAPELSALQPELSARGVELVFITLGDADENRPLLEEHGLEPWLLLGEGRETEVFAGVGTPAAYLVDREGRAESALTIGADKVPLLARSAAGR